ncbi:glycosyltransferase family 2 protein [Limibacillus halophilus]|uniref:Dolichol-phosphate mannosyltransferase n=1 Tax=Limibacillus halophilus TaxID=1579333 RepID=A0A839SPF2_9PROT|nr:glycosyltransferase family 2 protein [Limibacillus halophilus]MBB3064691.1 dolichol-phosphate mannosyltransferase [Limibacillus halophilus]
MPGTSKEPDFSVVISLYNEIDNLAPVVEEIHAVLTGNPGFKGILLVDDGSTDGSSARLQALMQRFDGLTCLRHERCCGKSRGVLTGAKAADTPWLLLMDGDGQNDPRDAALLFQALEEGGSEKAIGMVAGLRRNRRDSLWKRFGSRIGNGVRRLLLKDGCPDTGCGLKLVRRDAFLALPFFDGQHRYMGALMNAQGWSTLYCWVGDRPRLHGASKVTNLGRAFRGMRDLLGVLWLLQRSRNPKIERLSDGKDA